VGPTRWRCLSMARSDDQPETYVVAQAPGFARRTAINLLGRIDRALSELTDETGGCSVDAVMAADGPYRKFRVRGRSRPHATNSGCGQSGSGLARRPGGGQQRGTQRADRGLPPGYRVVTLLSLSLLGKTTGTCHRRGSDNLDVRSDGHLGTAGARCHDEWPMLRRHAREGAMRVGRSGERGSTTPPIDVLLSHTNDTGRATLGKESPMPKALIAPLRVVAIAIVLMVVPACIRRVEREVQLPCGEELVKNGSFEDGGLYRCG